MECKYEGDLVQDVQAIVDHSSQGDLSQGHVLKVFEANPGTFSIGHRICERHLVTDRVANMA